MTETSPVTEGLVTIHRIITNALNKSIRICDEYISGKKIPPDEIEGFTMYISTLKRITHLHHLSEDEIAFPFVKKYIDAPYDILKDDHLAIADDLQKMDQCLLNISIDNIVRLRAILNELQKIWLPHIRIEEESFNSEKIFKVAGMDEQLKLIKELSDHGSKNAGPGHLIIPFMIYSLEGKEREDFIKPFPLILKKVLIPILWKKKWRPMIPFLMYSQC